MYVKEGNHFLRKQKSYSKTENIFDNQNAFSKASHNCTFLGEVYQNTLTMMNLETFLKESNEEVIKVNQIMRYTKCRLSHYTLTYNKKRLERNRIFVGINIQSHVWETGAAPKKKAIYRHLSVSKAHIWLNLAGVFWPLRMPSRNF